MKTIIVILIISVLLLILIPAFNVEYLFSKKELWGVGVVLVFFWFVCKIK